MVPRSAAIESAPLLCRGRGVKRELARKKSTSFKFKYHKSAFAIYRYSQRRLKTEVRMRYCRQEMRAVKACKASELASHCALPYSESIIWNIRDPT